MLKKVKSGKRKSSIAKKLSFSVLAVLVPALIVLIVVVCTMASNAVTTLTQEKLENQTNYAVSIVNGFFENKLSVAEVVSVNPTIQNFLRNTSTVADMNAYEGRAGILLQMADISEQMQNEDVKGVWLVNLASEQMLYSTGEMMNAGLNTANWDDLVLNTKSSAVCDPYTDPLTGENMVSVVAPVFAENGSSIVGIVGLDIYVSDLNKKLGGIQVGQAGYLELLSTDSVYIVSDDASAIGKKVSDLDIDADYISNIQNRYEGAMTFSYDGIAYYCLSSISDATNWLAVATLPQSEIDATRNRLILVLVVLSALLLVGLTLIIAKLVYRMLKPLAEVGTGIQEFANGNLGVEIAIQTDDEIGQLAENVRSLTANLRFIIEDMKHIMSEMALGNFTVNSMNLDYYKGDFDAIIVSMRDLRNRMNSTLLQIEQSSAQVSSGSEMVSSGAQALAQGATEQASSVEELAATIDLISQQTKENAQHADRAREQTSLSGHEITACNQQMSDMIVAMNEISEQSGEIEKIIKTIEDIAFQTNILALNAAVEAARAGEAGKGFAVVADEVRNLASKSAEASKNTAALIEGTVQAVNKGTGLANATAQALESVVNSAAEVVSSVDKIALATEQQAASITQVTIGIDQISSVVQTNSATAEESAAASEELSSQAQLLKELVGQFELFGKDTVYEQE